MSWMARQVQQFGQGFEQDLQRYIRAAGIYQAVHDICGAFGVRRFILRFAKKNSDIALQEVESIALQYGGGAPTHTTKEALGEVRKALLRLYNNMLGGPTWNKGAVAIIRDCDNNLQVLAFFDEDADQIAIEHLPIPTQGHPLESKEYVHMKASLEAQLEPIMAHTQSISHDWDMWEIQQDNLHVLYVDSQGNQSVETKRCAVLATFMSEGVWEWQVEEPLFSQEVFCWENFVCDWDAAVELGLVCVAKLNATWLFFSIVNEDPQTTLFVAVWD
jgi:hypothetical protein